MKKVKVPYLTEYCNLSFEWQSTGIDIDIASESQIAQLNELQSKPPYKAV